MDVNVLSKVEHFFSRFATKNYKKGEILVRADENPTGIFFLKKGIVKQYAISLKGDELVVNLFKPRAFFPMSWAMNDADNSYYFEAMSPVELCKAPREDVLRFVKENPDVLYDLLSRVYLGTDGLQLKMTYLMAGNAGARLLTELIILSNRFGEGKTSNILIEISEPELSSMTGLTRETISREFKKLKEKKIITYAKNQLTISSLKLLSEELNENPD